MVAPIFFEQGGLGRLANRAVWAYRIVHAGNAAVAKRGRVFCYTRTSSGQAPIVRNGF